MNFAPNDLAPGAPLVADAGRPAPPLVLDDPFPALFALVRVAVELSGADARERALSIGTFRL
ncbi:MAG: hypothetical protein IT479_15510 [Xanthomonadales bacterium]|nr:hypothetical protein [Xanthomonadales bacterium]